jgi:hypothetical protein
VKIWGWFTIACLAVAQSTSAVTIYRIGGESIPQPELSVPYDFVQLSWSDVEPARHGRAYLLEMDPNFIAPQQLDPSVNLTPQLEELGGRILSLTWTGWGPALGRDIKMFDGDLETAFLGDGDWGGDYGVIRQKSMIFDLGGVFLLDRIELSPRERFLNDRFIETLTIGLNDGDPLKDGTREFASGHRGQYFDFDIAHQLFENTESQLNLKLPQVPVRMLLFEAPENARGIWEVAELKIYGIGFAPEASYVSNVIDLGASASLGEVVWSGSQDAVSEIDIAMRAGDDEDPNNYWRFTFRGDERARFDANGLPLVLKSYNRLDSGEKAGITHDTENWDFWSTAYEFDTSRGDLVSNKPRRFVQFKADFTSGLASGGQLDYLQFKVSIPPVADQVMAEITPNQVPAGIAASFTYKMKPLLKADDLGFDSISIDTPAQPISVDALRIGGVEANFELISLTSSGFTVRIPRVDTDQTGELIEIDFQAEVFKYGTVFSGRVFDSERPEEVHQTVTPGDADPLVDANGLRVDLRGLSQKTIQAMRLSSPVITPNADGINDEIEIVYDLLNLTRTEPATVEVYDLAGRRLGAIRAGVAESGRFSTVWNGRDDLGNVLPPGLYIIRLMVETDNGTVAKQRTVSLAY